MKKLQATRHRGDNYWMPSGATPVRSSNVRGRLRPLAVAMACAAILTGCGGGGSGSTADTTSSGATASAVPTITSQPQSQSTTQGQNATFSVVATGDALSYQWQSSATGQTWQNITGATGSSYTVTAAGSALNGTLYRVIITSAGIQVYSAVATLTLGTSAASTVSVQPGSSVLSGGAVTFSVPTDGNTQTFQWQSSNDKGNTWNDIPGANAAEYLIAAVKLAMSGLQYRAQITEGGVVSTSNTITLAVSCPPLQSRLGGKAVYDSCLNVTWLVNANLPTTLPLGITGIQADGSMPWSTANAWVRALNTSSYLGFSDWRMPNVGPVAGANYQFNGSTQQGNTGQLDLGYNISAPGTLYAGSTGTELPFLFYNELNGSGDYSVTGAPQTASLPNNGTPFQNMALGNSRYWTATPYGSNGAFSFSMAHGDQHAYVATGNGAWQFNVMVLRTGDVGGN